MRGPAAFKLLQRRPLICGGGLADIAAQKLYHPRTRESFWSPTNPRHILPVLSMSASKVLHVVYKLSNLKPPTVPGVQMRASASFQSFHGFMASVRVCILVAEVEST